MGFLSKARDYVEEKVDDVQEPVRQWSRRRDRQAQTEARIEYSNRVADTAQREQRGEISQELAAKRLTRAKKTLVKHEVPVEKRVGRAATKAFFGAADAAYNPGGRGFVDSSGKSYTPKYARRIASGRKSTYDMLSGSAGSYNRNVPSAFGLGTGKGKRRTQDKTSWGMLTGSGKGSGSKGGGGFNSGAAMLYGAGGSGSSSRRKRGRGGSGGGGSDSFWMLG